MVTNLDLAFYTALIISVIYKVTNNGAERLLWAVIAGLLLAVDMYISYKG